VPPDTFATQFSLSGHGANLRQFAVDATIPSVVTIETKSFGVDVEPTIYIFCCIHPAIIDNRTPWTSITIETEFEKVFPATGPSNIIPAPNPFSSVLIRPLCISHICSAPIVCVAQPLSALGSKPLSFFPAYEFAEL
jgi:hypothetical protein